MTVNDSKPFGLREMYVYERTASTPTYDTGVELTYVSSFTVDQIVTEGLLEGEDITGAVHANLDRVEVSFENGGMPLDVYAMLLGSTLTDSGGGTSEQTILDIGVGDVRPYFGWIARSVGDDGGDTMYIGYKFKMNTGGGGTFAKGQFYTGSFGAVGIPSDYDSDRIIRPIHRVTAAVISSTWTSNPVVDAA